MWAASSAIIKAEIPSLSAYISTVSHHTRIESYAQNSSYVETFLSTCENGMPYEHTQVVVPARFDGEIVQARILWLTKRTAGLAAHAVIGCGWGEDDVGASINAHG